MDCIYLFSPLVDIVVMMEEPFPIDAGETKSVSQVLMSAGGGANTLFAAKRVGLEIAPFGAVGDDSAGRMIREDYLREGICTDYLSVAKDVHTAYVIVLVDGNGRHAFASMLDCHFDDLTRLAEAVNRSRAIIVSGYQMVDEAMRRTMAEYLALAHGMDKLVCFDPGPMIPRIPEEFLKNFLRSTDILFVNDEEAALLTGCANYRLAAEQLSCEVRQQVVLKLGADGCYIKQKDVPGCVYPGFTVPLVDTTGAGDSFLAAYLRGYLAGWSTEETALFANAMGAAKTAKRGCGTQVPTLEEVLAVLHSGGYVKDADAVLHWERPKRYNT